MNMHEALRKAEHLGCLKHYVINASYSILLSPLAFGTDYCFCYCPRSLSVSTNSTHHHSPQLGITNNQCNIITACGSCKAFRAVSSVKQTCCC